MANITFDANHQVEDFTLVLAYKNNRKIGLLNTVTSVVYKENLNAANEISFKVYKERNGTKCTLWDEIKDFKSLYIKETNEYFELNVVDVDDIDGYKNVVGTSRAEAELGQLQIDNIEINTDLDIARNDYKEPTIIYDPDKPECSLLHRILEKAPNYNIRYVASSIAKIQRTFSISNSSIYDFLTGELAQELECLFLFDSANREIYVHDLKSNCIDCGCRDTFNKICPDCGSTKILTGYGEDTGIFISTRNFADSITLNSNKDEVKNTLKLVAGDDLMTATIANINPNGSSYIHYISDETKADMSKELVEKLDAYDKLYNSCISQYQTISNNIYNTIDQILYLTSGMMPDVSFEETNSHIEAAKLTSQNLSPLGLLNVSASTSIATINSALLNYIKVYIDNAKFKVSANADSYSYRGIDTDGYHYGHWIGNFTIENRADESDTCTSILVTIKVYDNYEDFLNQKIEKAIAENDEEDGSVFDVLTIQNLDDFRNALNLYCLNRLTSFYDAIQTVLDIMIEKDQASPSADFYQELYLPYKTKLEMCQTEIDNRKDAIAAQNRLLELGYKSRDNIQNQLNFEKYLGEELYKEFCCFRREDVYENSNYISDGLDNAQLLEKAQEFLDVAKKEIVKSGTVQHTLSASLNNLLQIKEFLPLVEHFSAGNWIHIEHDDVIYRLRLLNYEIAFDTKDISVEFSDATIQYGTENDVKSILDSAKSMASSYSYVARQAEQGEKAQYSFQEIYEKGMNAALYRLKSNNSEEFVIDNHGITGRSYDDITDTYSPEQIKITSNVLAFTEDNWNSTSLALGKTVYRYFNSSDILTENEGYGLISKFVTSGYIWGSQIISGNIYSENYSSTSGTHINLRDGTFSFAGGNLTYNGNQLSLTGAITATRGSIGGWMITPSSIYRDSPSFMDTNGMYFGTHGLSLGDGFSVTSSGYLKANNVSITGTIMTKNDEGKATHMDSGIIKFYRSDTFVGSVGTKAIYNDNSKKGLAFDLETECDYITWAYRINTSDNFYTMKWTYAGQEFFGGGSTYSANTLHAGCDIDMHNYTLKNVKFEGGGITQTIDFVQILEMNEDGTVARYGENGRMVFQNGILVDLTYYTK